MLKIQHDRIAHGHYNSERRERYKDKGYMV